MDYPVGTDPEALDRMNAAVCAAFVEAGIVPVIVRRLQLAAERWGLGSRGGGEGGGGTLCHCHPRKRHTFVFRLRPAMKANAGLRTSAFTTEGH